MTSPVSITPEQKQQLHEELLRTLTRLERSVTRHGSASRPAEMDQTCIGRLSRIEALQNQSFTQGLKEREKIRFEQVLDALRRIEDGSYGICAACKVAIPSERLLVFPETRTCTRCG